MVSGQSLASFLEYSQPRRYSDGLCSRLRSPGTELRQTNGTDGGSFFCWLRFMWFPWRSASARWSAAISLFCPCSACPFPCLSSIGCCGPPGGQRLLHNSWRGPDERSSRESSTARSRRLKINLRNLGNVGRRNGSKTEKWASRAAPREKAQAERIRTHRPGTHRKQRRNAGRKDHWRARPKRTKAKRVA